MSIFFKQQNFSSSFLVTVKSQAVDCLDYIFTFSDYLFMKGNFDAYVLWTLDKMVQNWIVDPSTARDFTEFAVNNLLNIQASFGHGVLSRLVPCIEDMELVYHVLHGQNCPVYLLVDFESFWTEDYSGQIPNRGL